MATHIYLVRHAEPHNPDGIVYGRLKGFRLSDRGCVQAEAAGRWLASVQACRLYSSPLLRARQTAALIRRFQPQADGIHIRHGLLEVRTSYDGLSFSTVPGFNYYEPRRSPADETIEQLFRRMDRTLRRITSDHAGQTVICVSHGDPIASVRVGYQDRPFFLREMRSTDYPDFTSITVLRYADARSRPSIECHSLLSPP